jgi:hypothetical protein
MSVIGGEVVEREIAGVGLLRFENCGPGEWLTQKGEPAKKGRRRYLLDGEAIDSVSSIVDTLSKYALMGWHEDHGARGGAKAALMGEVDHGTPPEDIINIVRGLDLGAERAQREASGRGAAVHTTFELRAHGHDVDLDAYPAEWGLWFDGARRAWDALNPQPLEVERPVCHPEHRYGGRPDMVASCEELVTLIDWKTGKGNVYDSAHYQTRLYQMALERCELADVERMVIVGIDDVGGFQLVECEATEEDALALLHTFRARKRINAGMAAQRKAAKEAMAA